MEEIVEIFKALSEEIRVRMLLLLTHGELCVCDLMAVFDEPQSKVSRHLAYLKRSGLVRSRRVGAWMHYSVREDLDKTAKAQLALIREALSGDPSFKKNFKKLAAVKKARCC